MIAVVQTLPTRKKGHKDQFVVTRPKAKEYLDDQGHRVEQQGCILQCYQCGQEWARGKHFMGEQKCPGPTQQNRPWI
eukprot:9966420-Karenia_brevis.AAC.1